jgi:hypothetical protein
MEKTGENYILKSIKSSENYMYGACGSHGTREMKAEDEI